MRTRADSVFISGVLFTVALVSLIPAALCNALAGRELATLDAGFRAEAQTAHDLGIACLVIILIGAIVIWTGYVKRARSGWLVMFIVVWFWAFPLFILPLASALVHGRIVLTFSETLYDAISEGAGPRSAAESVMIFSLMVIALLLPIRGLFGDIAVERPIPRPSAKLVGFSAIGVLLIMIMLYVWVRVGVLYEIPASELSSTQRLPSPPPPPRPM